MSYPRILVVASDTPLRHSLTFALTAEDFWVTSRPDIHTADAPMIYACTVIDHHAMGSDPEAARRFFITYRPVVLLANHPHELSALAFRTLLKPGLGAALIKAVTDAVAISRSGTQ